MKIYLVRHGESIGNVNGIHQGQKNDFPLSESGKRQAELLKKRFENIKIDAIYSSDLKRAKETAEFLADSKKISVILDLRLRERDFGIIGEQKDLMNAWKNYLEEEIKKGINPKEARPTNGESDKDHFDRVNSFFEHLINTHKNNESIIVVAHGGTNKVAFGVIKHFILEEMYKTPQANTCVNELVFENNKWIVNSINNTDHLEIDDEIIDLFNSVRDEPLDVINNRCWEKHIKLKKLFEDKGYKTKYKICSFKWSEQKLPIEIKNLIDNDLDYHLYLIVKINGLKLLIDASNDFQLPEYNTWNGKNNCNLCVSPAEFIEENIEEIINKKINEKYSIKQIIFLNEVNAFLKKLREKSYKN